METPEQISFSYQINLMDIPQTVRKSRKRPINDSNDMILLIHHKIPITQMTDSNLPKGADKETYFFRKAAIKTPLISMNKTKTKEHIKSKKSKVLR